MSLIQISQAQGRVAVTVFHIQARVNLGNVAELDKAAKEEYEKGGRYLVIDLSKVDSISSVGIRSIVSIYKRLLKDREKRLKLAAPNPYIHETLQIAGIDETIEVYDTVEAAVAAF
jgi:anti-sigma B factor antagonist